MHSVEVWTDEDLRVISDFCLRLEHERAQFQRIHRRIRGQASLCCFGLWLLGRQRRLKESVVFANLSFSRMVSLIDGEMNETNR